MHSTVFKLFTQSVKGVLKNLRSFLKDVSDRTKPATGNVHACNADVLDRTYVV